MPISAQPAAPFAPRINERFAAAEQYNKIFPQLASLYESAGRNFTQASAQTAQNQTQASAVSAGLEARRIAQERDAEFDAQRQQQQIAAQMAMQERAAQMEMERMNFRITKQEEMENTTRMNGLVQLEQMEKQKLLTKEQAADARYELITGIQQFQNRQKMQQAQAIEQQSKMQQKAFDDNQKNIVLAQSLGKQTAGANWIPIVQANGDVEFYGYDATGKYYQIGKKAAASDKPEKVGGEWSHLSTPEGTFDLKKGLADAKAFVESEQGPRPTEKDKAGQAEWDDRVRRAVDGRREEFNKAKQQAPVTAPQQGASGQNDQAGQVDPEIAKLQAKGLPPEQLQFASQVVQLMRALIDKGKSGQLSPAEKAQLAQAVEQYKSFQR